MCYIPVPQPPCNCQRCPNCGRPITSPWPRPVFPPYYAPAPYYPITVTCNGF